MKITSMDKAYAEKIKESISRQLMSHPLFMFYCPNRSERDKFINNFLDYYLYSWTKYGEGYISDSGLTLASLVSTEAFEFKFKGKNALKMKMDKNSQRILHHRSVVGGITNIIVPPAINTRVLTIYGSPDRNFDDIASLVKEIQEHAKEKGFAIVYETFSRKLVEHMAEQGFEVAYQKQFTNTQFFQTLMTYNV